MKLLLRFGLEDAAERSGVESETILRFVSHSWIVPVDPQNQVFDEEDIARIQLIIDLQEKFGVDDEAVPIILHLIDQLNRIHLELR